MQSKRPILGIGPVDGDLAEILKETDAGQMVDFNDVDSLKKILLDYYRSYKEGKLSLQSKNIDKYHRKNLTKNLAVILKGL